MSTRYYILTKDKEFVDKYFPAKTNDYYVTDEPYLSYEITIGDRSSGWKPLFRTHNHAYNSVKEMKKFLSEHLDKIEIYNSYNEKLDFQTLNDELIDWENKQEVKYYKCREIEPYDDRVVLIESNRDDYDIRKPFDHIEFDELLHKNTEESYFRYAYAHDQEGYDFIQY